MNPKISVIMSVYNDSEYLTDCIESILNQSFANFEFIITNDCSTDDSLQIIRNYANHDKRIKLINNVENIGLTKSLNKMIKIAKGEYIARMDGDDISFPERFKEQIDIFTTKKEVDIVFANTIYIDINGKKICNSWRPDSTDKIISLLPYRNYITHPTVMVKRNCLEKYNGYNNNCRTGQDHELWSRMKAGGVHFYFLNKRLLYYRLNPGSVRANDDPYWFKVAKSCIANKNKIKALSYLCRLTLKHKFVILVKFLIPHSFLVIKGLNKAKKIYKRSNC